MRHLLTNHGRYGLADNVDNLFNGFFNNAVNFEDGKDYMPAVDVTETKDEVALTFEIPGMNKEDIKVWVEDNVLTVSGERKSRVDEKETNFVRTEIRSGAFSRSFRLPKYADAGKVSADYANGLLKVTVARAEEAKPKEIEIKVS